MDIKEYKQRVINLFQGGGATPEQWAEMATVVLFASEDDAEKTEKIDDTLLGPLVQCPWCEEWRRPDAEGSCPCAH